MSLEYRIGRIQKICDAWGLDRPHDLMAAYKIDKDIFEDFRLKIKLYLCKALKIKFQNDDNEFISSVNKSRENRVNITPNGGVVPKREFHLEYNILLREWCEIIKKVVASNPKLITRFRATPNIRIKFGEELEDNLKRPLNTSLPHSDAWVEGPWGMNCFFPIIGDSKNNNLKYYEPIKFDDKMLATASTYEEMQWVMKNYKELKFTPEKGNIYFSDYALLHNTFRNPGCNTRVSIDTTLFVGNHLPHEDRLSEYRDKIPNIGLDEFIDAGKYEKEKYNEKKTLYSHYTSNTLKRIIFN